MEKKINSNKKQYILDEIYEVISIRAEELKQNSILNNKLLKYSYTQKLISSGINRVAQKLGEEAVETVIASINGTKQELISESSDLLYHLLVLWKVSNISPDEVYEELEKRNYKN